MPAAKGWSTYRALITPDSGTTALSLFLYADVYAFRQRTTNEYANIEIMEVAGAPQLALIGDPIVPRSNLQLVVVHESFSDQWQGPGDHVLVDGMLNGWITADPRPLIVYKPANSFKAAAFVSAAVLIVVLIRVAYVMLRGSIARRLP
jgi:hypothetical protein